MRNQTIDFGSPRLLTRDEQRTVGHAMHAARKRAASAESDRERDEARREYVLHRDRLIEAVTPLVFDTARKWFRERPDLHDDAVMNCFLYLARKIDDYDPDRAMLTTFMNGVMEYGLRGYYYKSVSMVHIPKHVFDRMSKLRKNPEFFASLDPSKRSKKEQLCKDAMFVLRATEKYRSKAKAPADFNGEGDDDDFNPFVSKEANPFDAVAGENEFEAVMACMERLPRPFREILQSLYGLNGRKVEKPTTIGKRISKTRHEVVEMEKSALRLIRMMMKEESS